MAWLSLLPLIASAGCCCALWCLLTSPRWRPCPVHALVAPPPVVFRCCAHDLVLIVWRLFVLVCVVFSAFRAFVFIACVFLSPVDDGE